MAGIEVTEVKSISVRTTDGVELKAGDAIVICIKGEDIVCEFVRMDGNNYFVTRPLVAGKHIVKYRPSSIEKCYRITSFTWMDRAKERLENAAAPATDYADQDTLAPATA